MSRVLFVLPFLPYPMTTGGHQAIYNGIAAAIASGAQVYITYPEYADQSMDRVKMSQELDADIHIFPYATYVSLKRERVLSVIYKIKYDLKRMIKGGTTEDPNQNIYGQWLDLLLPRSEDFCRFVNDLVERYEIDIVQCELLSTMAFVLTLPPKVKKYFVHHELGFVREGLHPISQLEPLAASANRTIHQLIEINLLNRFDTIITLSEIDTHKLQEAGVTTPVLSSFATINRKPKTSLESSCGFVLSFVGPEIHSPNKEGILWFLDSCWQRLLKSNPNYELRIIGLWSKETQRQLSDRYQNVHFLGYVDDLAATLKNTIMIVPIQVGSGIRMKILEAGMIGVPVVTTAVGVEGIPLVDGENCFIANTADAFVQSILKLSEQTLREHFIVSAQKVISKNYSLEALIKNREHLYQ